MAARHRMDDIYHTDAPTGLSLSVVFSICIPCVSLHRAPCVAGPLLACTVPSGSIP